MWYRTSRIWTNFAGLGPRFRIKQICLWDFVNILSFNSFFKVSYSSYIIFPDCLSAALLFRIAMHSLWAVGGWYSRWCRGLRPGSGRWRCCWTRPPSRPPHPGGSQTWSLPQKKDKYRRFEEQDELHQDDMKNRMNCTRTIWRIGWITPGRYEKRTNGIRMIWRIGWIAPGRYEE